MKTLLLCCTSLLLIHGQVLAASAPGDTGACCIEDPPTCFENLSELSCLALGGAWLGADSTCASCNPDPSGACCFGNSQCTDGTVEFCNAISGVWLGPDTTCAVQGSACEVVDPTGACCIGIGCDEVTEAICLANDGFWVGPETTCAGSSQSCTDLPLLVPEQFETIQAAIDAAEDGREIIVAPGVYFGSGASVIDTKGKPLFIRSRDGAETTFLDGEESRRLITCTTGEDKTTVIEGFTLVDGFSSVGGGIRVGFGSNPVIRSCIVRDCVATRGGGCSVEGGRPLFELCAFFSNESFTFGGGIDATNGSDFKLFFCSVEFNVAAPSAGHAGINVREKSVLTLLETRVCDNTPKQILGEWDDAGGSVVCSDCIADLTGTGDVGGADLTVVLGFWGPCADPFDCPADLTGDGVVDGADITVVLGNWGPCP